MAVMLPCAKRGRAMAVAFPVVAMILFDVLSNRVGLWTAVTAGTYGDLGLAFSLVYAALARRGRTVGRLAFLVSGAAGVLVFDFVGPIMSAIFRMPSRRRSRADSVHALAPRGRRGMRSW
jgi:hypothetical protein